MKRLLCAILALICIASLCSCDMLGKFISTEPEANPTTTTPSEAETTTPIVTTDILDPELSVSPEEVTWVETCDGNTDIRVVVIDKDIAGKYICLRDLLFYSWRYAPEHFHELVITINGKPATLDSPVFNYDYVIVTYVPAGSGEIQPSDEKVADLDRVSYRQLDSSTATQVDIGVTIDTESKGDYIHLIAFVYKTLMESGVGIGDEPIEWLVNGVRATGETRIYNNDVVSAILEKSDGPENPPAAGTITVHMQFQSGGIHAVEKWVKVETPCTFVELCAAFIKEHDLSGFHIVSYLNKEPIDINSDVYLQDGDHIYLEEYSGAPGDEPTCPHEWMDGYCPLCGSTCTHNEWNDMGQCIVCGFWMGVNLIEVEIYENGEYKYYTQVNEITMWDLVMAYYGYPWEYMVNSYDFYFNGMLITEGSYLITESGRVEAVTRSWNDDPNKPNDDPNDNPQGGKDPENTTAPDDDPTVPDAEIITVQITYQTGGVHRVESVITTTSPATLLEVYNLFVNEHPYEMFNNVQCSLNGKPIDPTQSVYVQNGDTIYLQEDGNGYHLHVWDKGMGRCLTCMEECFHEWEGNACRICKYECWHDYWIDSQCGICGMMCEHREWDDNRQCLACGAMLGVDLLDIEYYMDGEYCGCTSTIEYTVGEHLMFQFWRSWEDLTFTYDVYVGDVLVTDQYYMVVESCNIYLVTRTYDYQ